MVASHRDTYETSVRDLVEYSEILNKLGISMSSAPRRSLLGTCNEKYR